MDSVQSNRIAWFYVMVSSRFALETGVLIDCYCSRTVPSAALECLTATHSLVGLTQIFGGFVAYGVSYYDGARIAPWRIIYLLLGGLAIVVGICVVIWLPDSPLHAWQLSQEERVAVLERVRDDQGGMENRHWKKDQIIEALTDPRTWLIVLSTMLSK